MINALISSSHQRSTWQTFPYNQHCFCAFKALYYQLLFRFIYSCILPLKWVYRYVMQSGLTFSCPASPSRVVFPKRPVAANVSQSIALCIKVLIFAKFWVKSGSSTHSLKWKCTIGHCLQRNVLDASCSVRPLSSYAPKNILWNVLRSLSDKLSISLLEFGPTLAQRLPPPAFAAQPLNRHCGSAKQVGTTIFEPTELNPGVIVHMSYGITLSVHSLFTLPSPSFP